MEDRNTVTLHQVIKIELLVMLGISSLIAFSYGIQTGRILLALKLWIGLSVFASFASWLIYQRGKYVVFRYGRSDSRTRYCRSCNQKQVRALTATGNWYNSGREDTAMNRDCVCQKEAISESSAKMAELADKLYKVKCSH